MCADVPLGRDWSWAIPVGARGHNAPMHYRVRASWAAVVLPATILVAYSSSHSSTRATTASTAIGPRVSAFCAFARKYTGVTTTTPGSATALSGDAQLVETARQQLPFYRQAAQLAPPAIAPQLRKILHYVDLIATANLATQAGTSQFAQGEQESLTATGGEELDSYMHHVCHIAS